MNKFYLSTLNRFVDFCKRPNEENEFNASFLFKSKTLVSLFSFELIVLSLFVTIFYLLKSFNLLDVGANKVVDLLYELSTLQLILLVVVFAPILEELIFRLPLRFEYNYLFQLIGYLVSITRLIPKEKLHDIWLRSRENLFRYFFYLLTISFGLIHITNFEASKSLLAWMPFLTLNQLFIGFILGFLRIKFGLIWSIVYHSLNNLIFFGLAILSMNSISDYQFKGDSYSVTIQKVEKPLYKQDNLFQIIPGKIEFKNYRLGDAIQVLVAKPAKYIVINDLRGMYVDINFCSNTAPHKVDFAKRIVLDHIQKALDLKLVKQRISKEVLELYISDSIKNKMAIQGDSNSNPKLSLAQICRSLDRSNNNIYISSNDSNRCYSVDLGRKISLSEMEAYLLDKYGLRFRKVKKELEFIRID